MNENKNDGLNKDEYQPLNFFKIINILILIFTTEHRKESIIIYLNSI